MTEEEHGLALTMTQFNKTKAEAIYGPHTFRAQGRQSLHLVPFHRNWEERDKRMDELFRFISEQILAVCVYACMLLGRLSEDTSKSL